MLVAFLRAAILSLLLLSGAEAGAQFTDRERGELEQLGPASRAPELPPSEYLKYLELLAHRQAGDGDPAYQGMHQLVGSGALDWLVRHYPVLADLLAVGDLDAFGAGLGGVLNAQLSAEEHFFIADLMPFDEASRGSQRVRALETGLARYPRNSQLESAWLLDAYWRVAGGNEDLQAMAAAITAYVERNEDIPPVQKVRFWLQAANIHMWMAQLSVPGARDAARAALLEAADMLDEAGEAGNELARRRLELGISAVTLDRAERRNDMADFALEGLLVETHRLSQSQSPSMEDQIAVMAALEFAAQLRGFGGDREMARALYLDAISVADAILAADSCSAVGLFARARIQRSLATVPADIGQLFEHKDQSVAALRTLLACYPMSAAYRRAYVSGLENRIQIRRAPFRDPTVNEAVDEYAALIAEELAATHESRIEVEQMASRLMRLSSSLAGLNRHDEAARFVRAELPLRRQIAQSGEVDDLEALARALERFQDTDEDFDLLYETVVELAALREQIYRLDPSDARRVDRLRMALERVSSLSQAALPSWPDRGVESEPVSLSLNRQRQLSDRSFELEQLLQRHPQGLADEEFERAYLELSRMEIELNAGETGQGLEWLHSARREVAEQIATAYDSWTVRRGAVEVLISASDRLALYDVLAPMEELVDEIDARLAQLDEEDPDHWSLRQLLARAEDLRTVHLDVDSGDER